MGDLERRDDKPVRVSDADRNQVIELLRSHTGEGLLTLDEFGERVALVFEASTRADLEAVLDDLPRVAEQVPETRRRKVIRWAVAVLGEHSPKGRIRLADTTNAIAIMGHCQLDLRNAEIDGQEIEINCLAIMGGIDILVPEGIEVDMMGLAVFGDKRCTTGDVRPLPGSPVVHVRALAVFGDVRVRPPRWRG